METKNLREPEEKDPVTIDTKAEVIDPLNKAATVDRDYSTGFQSNDVRPIAEPTIQSPSFDEPTPENDNNDVYDFSKSKSKKESDDEDDDDDFGFELNGETVVYLLDFLYGLFKSQYKITPELLERKGLEKDAFNYRIIVEDQRVTVGQFAEHLNEMMDGISISTKDKNQIKKIVTHLSKKHNVKLSDEAQLGVILAKIGFETHLQMVVIQSAMLEKIGSMTPEYRQATAPTAPTPDQANDIVAEVPTDDASDYVRSNPRNGKAKRKYVYSGKFKKQPVDLSNYKEPGEKK
jgi:hypothetical protein